MQPSVRLACRSPVQYAPQRWDCSHDVEHTWLESLVLLSSKTRPAVKQPPSLGRQTPPWWRSGGRLLWASYVVVGSGAGRSVLVCGRGSAGTERCLRNREGRT